MLSSIFRQLLLLCANLPLRSKFMDRRRWRVLRLAGVRAEPSEIRSPVDLGPIRSLQVIRIGQNTFINAGLRIAAAPGAAVEIGQNCAIGPNVSFETEGHNLVWSEAEGWGHTTGPITVGDRCWIGARAVILANVVIGHGAVVAAGSVVTRDVAPYTLVGGVPAKPLRSLGAPQC